MIQVQTGGDDGIDTVDDQEFLRPAGQFQFVLSSSRIVAENDQPSDDLLIEGGDGCDLQV